jgi:UDP-N-acetyl-D-mannosaminuronic acid dehydrogenase
MAKQQSAKYEVCIIGGAGHVGLPLGVSFARKGVATVLLDINHVALKQIVAGKFPFREEGGDEALKAALKKKKLAVSSSPRVISESRFVVLVVGTPLDPFLNPYFRSVLSVVDSYLPYFRDGQICILRSTVFPGMTEKLQSYFGQRAKNVRVAFCPERVVEGKALEETQTLPQIISALDEKTADATTRLFEKIASRVIRAKAPLEAELAKLYSNAWRYITFAAANELYMIAEANGADYHHIYTLMTEDYPRNKHLPRPMFAAGPCLRKDTMQVAAFSRKQFTLGAAAMFINESMPNHVLEAAIACVGGRREAMQKTLGILGMTFKPESDDPRESLSFKLRKLGEMFFGRVFCHDPHLVDRSLSSLPQVLNEADVIVLAMPHAAYRSLDRAMYPGKIFVDACHFWSED